MLLKPDSLNRGNNIAAVAPAIGLTENIQTQNAIIRDISYEFDESFIKGTLCLTATAEVLALRDCEVMTRNPQIFKIYPFHNRKIHDGHYPYRPKI